VLHRDFEPRAKSVVEFTEADEGAETLTVGREAPVRDEVKFRRGRAVAIGGDIAAYVFVAVLEEVAFRPLEGDLVLEDLTDAVEIFQKGREVAG
jgi:hypothetical protein